MGRERSEDKRELFFGVIIIFALLVIVYSFISGGALGNLLGFAWNILPSGTTDLRLLSEVNGTDNYELNFTTNSTLSNAVNVSIDVNSNYNIGSYKVYYINGTTITLWPSVFGNGKVNFSYTHLGSVNTYRWQINATNFSSCGNNVVYRDYVIRTLIYDTTTTLYTQTFPVAMGQYQYSFPLNLPDRNITIFTNQVGNKYDSVYTCKESGMKRIQLGQEFFSTLKVIEPFDGYRIRMNTAVAQVNYTGNTVKRFVVDLNGPGHVLFGWPMMNGTNISINVTSYLTQQLGADFSSSIQSIFGWSDAGGSQIYVPGQDIFNTLRNFTSGRYYEFILYKNITLSMSADPCTNVSCNCYVPSGNLWNITDTVICSNTVLRPDQNAVLRIWPNASLTLYNTTLWMNLSSSGTSEIEVRGNGSMFIYNSTINATDNTKRFRFIVRPYSNFSMINSTLSGTGYMFSGLGGAGLSISNSAVIVGNRFVKNFAGIVLEGARYSFISGNTFSNNDDEGLLIFSGTNNTFTNNNFTNNAKYGAYLNAEAPLIDSKLFGNTLADIYIIGGGNRTLLNTTFQTVSFEPTATAVVVVQWYLDVTVLNTSGQPVSGATVQVDDVGGNSAGTAVTDALGKTRLNITAYLRNIGGILFNYTPHRINITSPGYSSNATEINITNNTKVTITIKPLMDVNVSLILPPNNTVAQSRNIIFTCSAALYNAVLKNISLWTNISGSWSPFYSQTTSPLFASVLLPNYGIFNWSCLACETGGYCVMSPAYKLTLQNLAPSLTLTPGNNTAGTARTFTLSCDASDADGIKNTTINTSSLGSNSTTTGSGRLSLVNVPDGSYSWNCTSCDNFNLCNVSGNYAFTVQNFAPSLTLTPTNNSVFTARNFTLTCDASDADGIKNTTINSTLGNNLSMTGSAKRSLLNVPEGNYDWNCTSCDAFGLCNFSGRYRLSVLNLAPAFTLSPENNTVSATGNFTLDCAASDPIDGIKNTTLVSDLDTNGTATKSASLTFVNVAAGNHYWNCTSCDGTDLCNFSGTHVITVDYSAQAQYNTSATVTSKPIVGGSNVTVTIPLLIYNIHDYEPVNFSLPSWLNMSNITVLENGVAKQPGYPDATHLNFTFNATKNYSLRFQVPAPALQLANATGNTSTYKQYFNITTPNHFTSVAGSLTVNTNYNVFSLWWMNGTGWMDATSKYAFSVSNGVASYDQVSTSDQYFYIQGNQSCGDGACNYGETCSSCQGDCGTCPVRPPKPGPGPGPGPVGPTLKSLDLNISGSDIERIVVWYTSTGTLQLNVTPVSTLFPDGKTYKSYSLTPSISPDISNITIYFRVDKTWVNQFRIDKATIRLGNLKNNTWTRLVPVFKSEDTFLHYTVPSGGFGTFAIYGFATAAPSQNLTNTTPENHTVQPVNETPDNETGPPEQPPKGSSYLIWYIIGGVFALLIIGGAIVFLRRPEHIHEKIKDGKLEQIKEYVTACRMQGMPDDQIESKLIDAGWSKSDIKEVLNTVKKVKTGTTHDVQDFAQLSPQQLEELRQFINTSKNQGYNKKQIKEMLLSAGWTQEVINEVLK